MIKDDYSTKKNGFMCAPLIAFELLNTICIYGKRLVFGTESFNTFFSFIRFAIPLLLFLRALRYMKHKTLLSFVIVELLFTLSYMFSSLNGFLSKDTILKYSVYSFLICTPFLLLSSEINDPKYLMKGYELISYICVPILSFYVINIANYENEMYSMTVSYMLIFYAIINTHFLFDKIVFKTKILFLLSRMLFIIFILAIVILKGARGSLLCFLFYLVAELLFLQKFNKKIAIILSLFVLTATFFIAFADLISLAVGRVLKSYGINSRTLDLIAGSNILFDSGRLELQQITLSFIDERPLLGYGPASDIQVMGFYPHNLFLELFFDYGIILGFIFSSLIILLIITNLLKTKSFYNTNLSLILISCGFVSLMISGTYLQNHYFFMLLGLSVNNNIAKNHPSNSFLL